MIIAEVAKIASMPGFLDVFSDRLDVPQLLEVGIDITQRDGLITVWVYEKKKCIFGLQGLSKDIKLLKASRVVPGDLIPIEVNAVSIEHWFIVRVFAGLVSEFIMQKGAIWIVPV